MAHSGAGVGEGPAAAQRDQIFLPLCAKLKAVPPEMYRDAVAAVRAGAGVGEGPAAAQRDQIFLPLCSKLKAVPPEMCCDAVAAVRAGAGVGERSAAAQSSTSTGAAAVVHDAAAVLHSCRGRMGSPGLPCHRCCPFARDHHQKDACIMVCNPCATQQWAQRGCPGHAGDGASS